MEGSLCGAVKNNLLQRLHRPCQNFPTMVKASKMSLKNALLEIYMQHDPRDCFSLISLEDRSEDMSNYVRSETESCRNETSGKVC